MSLLETTSKEARKPKDGKPQRDNVRVVTARISLPGAAVYVRRDEDRRGNLLDDDMTIMVGD